MNCINCKSNLSDFEEWKFHQEEITCPECGKVQIVIGDDYWNEETDDEWSFFITEEIE